MPPADRDYSLSGTACENRRQSAACGYGCHAEVAVRADFRCPLHQAGDLRGSVTFGLCAADAPRHLVRESPPLPPQDPLQVHLALHSALLDRLDLLQPTLLDKVRQRADSAALPTLAQVRLS